MPFLNFLILDMFFQLYPIRGGDILLINGLSPDHIDS